MINDWIKKKILYQVEEDINCKKFLIKNLNRKQNLMV